MFVFVSLPGFHSSLNAELLCVLVVWVYNKSISHEDPSIKGLRVLDMLNVKWSALMVMDVKSLRFNAFRMPQQYDKTV